MISYAGLQIAFAFFYSVFQGYAPDTDLDNVRNRVVGILFGLIVTGLVFRYIWPERTIDRFRDVLRAALRQLAKLVEIFRPDVSIEKTEAEADALIAVTSKTFEQARRYAELTAFEFDESPDRDRSALHNLESTQSHAEDVFAAASSLASGEAWNEWQKLPRPAKIAESELRRVAAKQIGRVASGDVAQHSDADLSRAFDAWHETVQPSASDNSRNALVSRIVTGVEDL
jgi:hypothetical protein